MDMDGLREANRRVELALNRFKETPPPEAEAYRLAAQIEESVGELAPQQAVSGQPASATMKLVQEVVGTSKDHAARIRKLIAQKGLH